VIKKRKPFSRKLRNWLGPAQLSLLVNDRGWLRYSIASSLREDIMLVPTMVGYGSVTFDFTWVESVDLKRPSVRRVLALAKVEALKEHEQHWGHVIDSVVF
jgi:hypothetical protein